MEGGADGSQFVLKQQVADPLRKDWYAWLPCQWQERYSAVTGWSGLAD